ncbi:MAG: UDP-N-acetylmuramoyl-L-alanyl-D-glutamate--2,6-diaminopimelate ligase [Syntrophus sp. (in: bacteria)]|nr:UDP-N-acetylmuramoyl-L-alanyl-D-glutamate--2,6-diaminopimelate ligase [Syntrophus sp. (in: bacteria)]
MYYLRENIPVMKLAELIDHMDIARIKGDPDQDITNITKDSRSVKDGALFFATKKSAPYIPEAIKRGAKVVVSEGEWEASAPCSILTDDVDRLLGSMASKFYGFPSRHLFVAGITGTNGKTTTTYLIESILREAGKKAGVIGTISYRYEGLTLKAENTTPGAAEIHGLLRDMYDVHTEYVAMEVSSHALDQKRVEGVDFDMAIFTNLTHDHLDYHGDFETYKAAKRLLFTYFLQKSKKEQKFAVLNMDDPNVKTFVPDPPVKTFFYSATGIADACLLKGQEDINGLELEISLMGRNISLRSPLVGIFNASNILAASLFGYGAGIPLETIKKGIESLKGVPGRVERIVNNRGISVFVDYAHTPDALKKVCELLNRLKKGRLIVIFGCGGDRDRTKRPVMGDIASRRADFAIVTSDNPRKEEPGRIIEEITQGMNNRKGLFTVIESRREAIAEGIRMARENDVVLIAGKGHEDYQIIGNQTFPFSDQETAEEFLNVAC